MSSQRAPSTPPGALSAAAGTAVLAQSQPPPARAHVLTRVPLLTPEPVWWSASAPPSREGTPRWAPLAASSVSARASSSSASSSESGTAAAATRRHSSDGAREQWRVDVRGVDTQIDCTTMQAVGVVYLDVTHRKPRSTGTGSSIGEEGDDGDDGTTTTTTRWQLSRTFVQCYALDVDLHYRLRRARLPQLPKRRLFKMAADAHRRRKRAALLQSYFGELVQCAPAVASETWRDFLRYAPDLLSLRSPDKVGALHRVRAVRSRPVLAVLKAPVLAYYEGADARSAAAQLPARVADLRGAAVRLACAATAAATATSTATLGSSSSSAFAVHFANGHVWHLEAASARDAAAWVAALAAAAAADPLVAPRAPRTTGTFSPGRAPLLARPLTRSRHRSESDGGSVQPPLWELLAAPSPSASSSSASNSASAIAAPTPTGTGAVPAISVAEAPTPGATPCATPALEEGAGAGACAGACAGAGAGAGAAGSLAALFEAVQQEKAALDKDLRIYLSSLELEVQRAGRNRCGSAVAPQLIPIVQALLRAAPDELVARPALCRDTVLRIQEIGKHAITSRLLYSIAPLSRTLQALDAVAQSHAAQADKRRTLAFSAALLAGSQSPLHTPRAAFLHSTSTSSTSTSSISSTSTSSSDESASAVCSPPPPTPLRLGSRINGGIGGSGGGGRTSNSSSSLLTLQQRRAERKIVCRICEDEYPQSVLQEHTRYCVEARECDAQDAACDVRLVDMLKLLTLHRKRMVESRPDAYCAAHYSAVTRTVTQVVALRYGDAADATRCGALLDTLQHILADLSCDDLGLVTYGRRFLQIVEEKWATMREFMRLQAESQDDTKPINLWCLLTLAKAPQQQQQQQQQLSAGGGSTAVPHEEILNRGSAKRVTIDDFEVLKRISSGAYGKVYLARKKKTRDLYALKVQRKADMVRKNMVDNVIAERRVLSTIHNPFCVKLFYAFQNERHLYLVMEYCPGGDLATLLRNLECFDLDMARVYAADIVRSLEALHSMAYVHRDLKPDNILVNAKGHLLLTDFGLSSVGALEETRREPTTTATATNETTSTNDKPVRVVGTPDYLAPEMLLGTGHGPEVDWWALGIMLYEFLTGCPPFNDTSPEAIFGRILRRDIVWPDDMDADARDLIERLLTVDPAARLGHRGADEVKAHPFFAEIDWDTLLTQDRSDYFVPRLDSDTDTSYHEDHRQTNTGTGTGSDCSWNKTGVPQPAAAAAASGGATFSGFEFTNTSSLLETTLSLASEQDDAPVDGGS